MMRVGMKLVEGMHKIEFEKDALGMIGCSQCSCYAALAMKS